MLYISIFLIIIYSICWFTFKGDNKFYMNAIFGVIVTILYLYNRFRTRYMMLLDEHIALAIIILIIIIFISLIFRQLLRRYKKEWYEISIKIIDDYYSETFHAMHRVLFFNNSWYFYSICCWGNIFPEKHILRLSLFFIFQIIPIGILILLFLFEGCQGYLYYSLKFLVLLGVPLILKIWANLKVDLGKIGYNEVLPVYNEMRIRERMEKIFLEEPYEYLRKEVYEAYKRPEVRPLFLNRTPQQYLDFSLFILHAYKHSVEYKILLTEVRTNSYLSFLFIICLVLFINILPLLNTDFLYYSYSFSVYLFYSF